MMSIHLPLTSALAALLATLCAVPADAQIYAWRDANGVLVLSDRKTDPAAQTYEVPKTRTFRATRPATSRALLSRYEPLIQAHASRYALAPDLVRAVIQVESGFDPRARSPRGAMGLMQLMPQTALLMGVRDPYDAEDNIRGGAGYLRQLLDRYDGREDLALAAYNAGPGAVEKAGKQVPPYQETRDYVKRVGSAASSTDATASHAAQAAPASRIIYKIVEIVDGRPVARYSTERPSSGPYEILAQ